ncbi:alpha-2-macroglobulin-like protein 1 [Sceloporus undulatus]|uniref:alpha-2-macroglobulin-like protein 1 n=1 Tax=Sceloporus undulatus TaxID=8520 RepID=UPI001C4C8634|nr:alpha-2-macroglobulin-like protein 1 [Sceloporus undulatus]
MLKMVSAEMWVLFLGALAPLLQLANGGDSIPNYMPVFPAQLTYPSSEKLCMDLSHMQKSVVLNITLETKVTIPILLDRFIWHKEQLKCFTFPVSLCVSVQDLF